MPCMRLPLLLALALLSLPGAALAQPGSPGAQPASSSGPVATTSSWQSEFDRANTLLLHHRFSAAAAAFIELAKRAPTPIEAALAREMLAVSLRWQRDGFELAPLGTTGDRSSGEMASLYTSAVFYGVGSGLALVAYTDADEAGGVILPSLALGGAAAFGVYAVDSNHTMRAGVPQSIITGMTIGLTQGMAWTFWNQARVRYDDEWSSKTVVTLIWGSTTAGALAGGIIGQRRGTSRGRASMLGSASLWTGAVAGMVSAGLAGDSDQTDDIAMLSAAVGLTGGAIGGYFLGEAENPSVARVRYLDLGGIAGGLLAGGLYLSAANDDSDGTAALLTTGTGIATGIAVAWLLTQDMAPGNDRQAVPRTTWVPSLVPVEGGGALAGVQGLL